MQAAPMQGTKGNRAQLLGQQEKGVCGGRGRGGGEMGEFGKTSLPRSGPVCFIWRVSNQESDTIRQFFYIIYHC